VLPGFRPALSNGIWRLENQSGTSAMDDMKRDQNKKDLIRSVDLKLARADFQVRTICDQISAWTSKNLISARCELREERLGFRLILEDFVEPPPLDDWGLFMGECVHNLRSALDNLAFALSRLRCDPPVKPRAIAFPIFNDKSQFEKRGRAKLGQMSTRAAKHIELLQPFQRDGSAAVGRPEDDALVLLQQLNNDDKHQVPTVVLLAPKETAHSFVVKFRSHADAKANEPPDATVWFDPLEPGVVLLDYRTNRPIERVHTAFLGKAIVAIQTAHRPAVDITLRNLSKYTALVVEQFRRFFE
jgi:hypothetical protein